MASIAITDLVIKKKERACELNPGHSCHGHAHYQLSYDSELNDRFFYMAYKVTVKKVENKFYVTKKWWNVYT
jgi:hypothetical protein